MSLRSIFSGCPGMQHTFKEGSGVRFYSGLISLWLFNIPLFGLAPSLIAIIVGMVIPYMIFSALFYKFGDAANYCYGRKTKVLIRFTLGLAFLTIT